MVSFDDAKAFAAKGKFIKTQGLRGFAIWEAGGDFKDILLDSISKAAGIEEDCDSQTETQTPPTTSDNGDDCDDSETPPDSDESDNGSGSSDNDNSDDDC